MTSTTITNTNVASLPTLPLQGTNPTAAPATEQQKAITTVAATALEQHSANTKSAATQPEVATTAPIDPKRRAKENWHYVNSIKPQNAVTCVSISDEYPIDLELLSMNEHTEKDTIPFIHEKGPTVNLTKFPIAKELANAITHAKDLIQYRALFYADTNLAKVLNEVSHRSKLNLTRIDLTQVPSISVNSLIPMNATDKEGFFVPQIKSREFMVKSIHLFAISNLGVWGRRIVIIHEKDKKWHVINNFGDRSKDSVWKAIAVSDQVLKQINEKHPDVAREIAKEGISIVAMICHSELMSLEFDLGYREKKKQEAEEKKKKEQEAAAERGLHSRGVSVGAKCVKRSAPDVDTCAFPTAASLTTATTSTAATQGIQDTGVMMLPSGPITYGLANMSATPATRPGNDVIVYKSAAGPTKTTTASNQNEGGAINAVVIAPGTASKEKFTPIVRNEIDICEKVIFIYLNFFGAKEHAAATDIARKDSDAPGLYQLLQLQARHFLSTLAA